MALHLNLLHEEILQQRQRQRDPLKIGMMVLGGLGALMLVYYLWNAYKVLEIRNRLSQVQHEWAKVEPKVTGAQKRSAELNGIISTTKVLDGMIDSRAASSMTGRSVSSLKASPPAASRAPLLKNFANFSWNSLARVTTT
jgi:hypothetical protein